MNYVQHLFPRFKYIQTLLSMWILNRVSPHIYPFQRKLMGEFSHEVHVKPVAFVKLQSLKDEVHRPLFKGFPRTRRGQFANTHRNTFLQWKSWEAEVPFTCREMILFLFCCGGHGYLTAFTAVLADLWDAVIQFKAWLWHLPTFLYRRGRDVSLLVARMYSFWNTTKNTVQKQKVVVFSFFLSYPH